MVRYPSKECEKCSIALEQGRAMRDAKNEDGSWKYPVFELAVCSCFGMTPRGCLTIKDEKKEI